MSVFIRILAIPLLSTDVGLDNDDTLTKTNLE